MHVHSRLDPDRSLLACDLCGGGNATQCQFTQSMRRYGLHV